MLVRQQRRHLSCYRLLLVLLVQQVLPSRHQPVSPRHQLSRSLLRQPSASLRLVIRQIEPLSSLIPSWIRLKSRSTSTTYVL